MIKISNRLKTTAELVLSKKSNKIIDVGCDHAILDIYLLQNNENLKIVASDNKEKPLESAKKNISRYSFLNKIEVCLKDGIENIDKEIDTVVISGMGCETIIEILNKDKDELSHVDRLIISSNNKYPKLREEIVKLGFIISNEKIVYEDEKYYIIIEFIKGKKKYKEKDYYFGPYLLDNKNELFYEYFNSIKNTKEKILEKIQNNKEKNNDLIYEIKQLESELKRN